MKYMQVLILLILTISIYTWNNQVSAYSIKTKLSIRNSIQEFLQSTKNKQEYCNLLQEKIQKLYLLSYSQNKANNMDLYFYLLKTTKQYCSEFWEWWNSQNLKDGIYIIPHNNMILDFPYYETYARDINDVAWYLETKISARNLIFFLQKKDIFYSTIVYKNTDRGLINITNNFDKVETYSAVPPLNLHLNKNWVWLHIGLCQAREWDEWKDEDRWWQGYGCNVFMLPSEANLIQWNDKIRFYYQDWEYFHYYKEREFNYDIFQSLY